jgi:hypothetical protein
MLQWAARMMPHGVSSKASLIEEGEAPGPTGCLGTVCCPSAHALPPTPKYDLADQGNLSSPFIKKTDKEGSTLKSADVAKRTMKRPSGGNSLRAMAAANVANMNATNVWELSVRPNRVRSQFTLMHTTGVTRGQVTTISGTVTTVSLLPRLRSRSAHISSTPGLFPNPHTSLNHRTIIIASIAASCFVFFILVLCTVLLCRRYRKRKCGAPH